MRQNTKPAELRQRQREIFLRELARDGNTTRAAKVAGIDRSFVFQLRKKNPEFGEGWAQAMAAAADKLEEAARRRAVDGVERPLYYQGAPVYLYRTIIGPGGLPEVDENGRDIRELVRDADGQPVQAMDYQYSDTLLAMLLKGALPDKYRDQSSVRLSDADGKPLLPQQSDHEIASRIAYLLEQGLRTKGQEIQDVPYTMVEDDGGDLI